MLAGGGTIGASGLYTAPASAGSVTVAATSGIVSGYAAVTVTDVAPTVATPAAASASTVTATSAGLGAVGADDGGASGLTYTWAAASGPFPVSFSDNGTNSAQNTTVTFTGAGSYSFAVTIANAGGLSTTSSVSVTVDQTPTVVIPSPSAADIADGGSQQLAATVLDQFNHPISGSSITWSVDAGGAGGTVNGAGLYTAPAAGSGADTVVATDDGQSAAAEVFVTNSPSAPPESFVVGEQTVPVTLDVLSGTTSTITSVTQPRVGAVATVDGSPDELIYTPVAGFLGTDAFSFQTSDGVSHPVGITLLPSDAPGKVPGVFPAPRSTT